MLLLKPLFDIIGTTGIFVISLAVLIPVGYWGVRLMRMRLKMKE